MKKTGNIIHIYTYIFIYIKILGKNSRHASDFQYPKNKLEFAIKGLKFGTISQIISETHRT